MSKKYELSADQSNAYEQISAWLNSDSKEPFILSGKPGTGKTFLTNHIAQMERGQNFLFTAPTNKASQQLELALKGNFPVKTTYSALGLKITNFSESRGLQQNTFFLKNLKRVTCMVVDECSMVDEKAPNPTNPDSKDPRSRLMLLDYLLEASKDYNFKLLFLGDEKQLPPPSSTNSKSPVFEKGWAHYELTEVMRHAGELLNYCNTMRDVIGKPGASFPMPNEFGFPLLRQFGIKEVDTNLEKFLTGELKYIAWRNLAVDNMNNLIRLRHFGGGCQELMPEDLLLFTQPLLMTEKIINKESPLENPGTWLKTDDFKICASIDSQAEVLSATPVNYWGIDLWEAKLRIEGSTNATGYFLRSSGQKTFKAMKKALKDIALKQGGKGWAVMHNFSDAIMPIKFSYALTAHRAQGSTFRHVLLDAGDVMKNRDRFTAYKCAYVGLSRAAESTKIYWK